MSTKLRRPHVVPAGYQRNFAETEQIRVIHKPTLSDIVIGVRDNFVARHFLRVVIKGEANDAAEDEFARIENAALPLIRSATPFTPRSPSQILAIKATMAMLWSRSFSREVISRRIHSEVLATFVETVPRDVGARQRFQRQHDRPAKPGELEAIVESAAAKLLRERWHDVGSMLRHHNEALAKFRALNVSLYQPLRGTEFLTSDNPVVLARTIHLIQVGAQNGLALGDSDFIFLPISRFVGACLTTNDEGDSELDRPTMTRLNQAIWRNAVERVACHPSLENWRAACNV